MFSQSSTVDASRTTSASLYGDGALKYLGETLTTKVRTTLWGHQEAPD